MKALLQLRRLWRARGDSTCNSDEKQVTRCATREEPPCGRRHVYTWDSMFLRDCLGRLTPGPDEELLIVTGVTTQNGHVVPCMAFRPTYEFASVGGVRAQGESSHSVLRAIQGSGHVAVAFLHSHPGSGAGSVRPSSTDHAAQERYERAGYQAITGIFSRDGHVQFFSNAIPFRLRVFGAGVRFVGRNLMKLEGV